MRLVDFVARRLRVLVHVDKIPFGWPKENPKPAETVAIELGSDGPTLLDGGPIAHRIVRPHIRRLHHKKPVI